MLLPIFGTLAGLALGVGVYHFLIKAKQQASKRTARRIIEDAQVEAERVKKEAFLEAREEFYKKRETWEGEVQEARNELRQLERRLQRREDSLERRSDDLSAKEKGLQTRARDIQAQEEQLQKARNEYDALILQEKKMLERISGFSEQQARDMLIQRIRKDVEHEAAEFVRNTLEKARQHADEKAKDIVCSAIQRCAADHTAESVVSAVDLPSDDMKGRIIGREGRNIRAFENVTGVDVIVDDTPGVVVLSAFDSVRREIARRAMEKLILDGRIHPARIEQVVQETDKEVAKLIQETGEQTALEVGIQGLNPKILNLMGRLKFRTSFGQNVLQHSVEVAHLAGIIAGELNLDIQLAKRCGLLHDIGKALDHEVEGGHPQIGADFLRRHRESPIVVNAAEAHHEGSVEPQSLYSIIVAAADGISAGRPGARRETLERYIKRLERLEEIANAFPGVETAFAIQAGREVRVIVNADKVSDREAITICRNIAREIEQELVYPGQVKITLIRETRVTEYAK